MVRSGGNNGSKEECDTKQHNDAGDGWHCVMFFLFSFFLVLISEPRNVFVTDFDS